MPTREYILKEILRCAEERGKTPSEKIFYEYAGVGIYDLHKFGWPNYGELVREVKLIPNKFDKTKYSHKQLCNLFIKVIREKGKWPTRGLLDVKHLNDNNFPDSSTFYKKLGLTQDLALTILQYVKDRRGYDDVVKICNPILEKYKKTNESSGADEIKRGFVYLGFQHNDYKIGFTEDLNRRRDDITLLGSEPMRLLHAIETDDMRGVERYWHNRYTLHLRGVKWITLTLFTTCLSTYNTQAFFGVRRYLIPLRV